MDEGSTGYRKWVTLFILTSVYVVGELSHFLLGIVTRPMAQEIGYGTEECLLNPKFQAPSQGVSANCYATNDSQSCTLTGGTDGANHTACIWNYSGLGIEYQILAGPAFIAVFTLSGVALGIVSDRVNRHLVVCASLLLLTCATALCGAAGAYWHLVILRMAIGAGESAFSPACISILSDIFPQVQSGLALGIFNWGIYFGYGLSYAIGNFVTGLDIGRLGWRWSYYISGFIGLVVLILLVTLVKEPKRKVKLCEEKVEKCCEGHQLVELAKSQARSGNNKDFEYNNDVSLWKTLLSADFGVKEVLKTFFSAPIVMLTVAACARHTAGFTWAYNTQLYFTTFYPDYNLGIWITAVSIGGGTIGVMTGGLVSDKLVKRIGLSARIYVLAGSQLLATPFAVSVLYFEPPVAFFCLLGSYLFAEMWFGVMFAILLELIPVGMQSTVVALFLFMINNVGGNALILVEPLRKALSYHLALLIMYPGLYCLSSILFFLSSFSLKRQ